MYVLDPFAVCVVVCGMVTWVPHSYPCVLPAPVAQTRGSSTRYRQNSSHCNVTSSKRKPVLLPEWQDMQIRSQNLPGCFPSRSMHVTSNVKSSSRCGVVYHRKGSAGPAEVEQYGRWDPNVAARTVVTNKIWQHLVRFKPTMNHGGKHGNPQLKKAEHFFIFQQTYPPGAVVFTQREGADHLLCTGPRQS